MVHPVTGETTGFAFELPDGQLQMCETSEPVLLSLADPRSVFPLRNPFK